MTHHPNFRRTVLLASLLSAAMAGAAVHAQSVQIGGDALEVNPDKIALNFRTLFNFGGTLQEDGSYTEALPSSSHCPQIKSDGRVRPAFDPVAKQVFGVLVNDSACRTPKYTLDADGNKILADLETRVTAWVNTLQPAVLAELKNMLGVSTNAQVIAAVVQDYDAMFKDIIDGNFGGLPLIYVTEKDDQGNTLFENGAFMYRVALPETAGAASASVVPVAAYGHLEAFGDITLSTDGTAYSLTTPEQAGSSVPHVDARLVSWVRGADAPQVADYGFLFAHGGNKAGTAGVLSGGAWAGSDADGANLYLYNHQHDIYRVSTADGREEHLAWLKDLSVPSKDGAATVALGDPSVISAVRDADGNLYAIYRLTATQRIAGDYLGLGTESERKDGFLYVLLRLTPEYLSQQPKDEANPRAPATPLAFLTYEEYDQSTSNQRAQIVEIGDYIYGRTSNRLWRVAKSQDHRQNHQVEFIKQYANDTGVRLHALAAGGDGWLYGRLIQGTSNYLFRVDTSLETAAAIGGSLQLLHALEGHAVEGLAASRTFERDGRLVRIFVGESGLGGANNKGALHAFDIDLGAAPAPEPEPQPEPEPSPEPQPEPAPTPTPDSGSGDSGGGGGGAGGWPLAVVPFALVALRRRGMAWKE